MQRRHDLCMYLTLACNVDDACVQGNPAGRDDVTDIISVWPSYFQQATDFLSPESSVGRSSLFSLANSGQMGVKCSLIRFSDLDSSFIRQCKVVEIASGGAIATNKCRGERLVSAWATPSNNHSSTHRGRRYSLAMHWSVRSASLKRRKIG